MPGSKAATANDAPPEEEERQGMTRHGFPVSAPAPDVIAAVPASWLRPQPHHGLAVSAQL